MTHQTIDKVDKIGGGVIIAIMGYNLLRLADDSYSEMASDYFFFGIFFLCFGIFAIVWSAFKQSKATVWSNNSIRARMISALIVIPLLCIVEPASVFGEWFLYIDELYVEVKNSIIATSALGIICDLIHLQINKDK